MHTVSDYVMIWTVVHRRVHEELEAMHDSVSIAVMGDVLGLRGVTASHRRAQQALHP